MNRRDGRFCRSATFGVPRKGVTDRLDLITLAASQHHLITVADVHHLGISDHRWRTMRDQGWWEAVSPSHYRHVSTPLTLELRARANLGWLGRDAALHGGTALWWFVSMCPRRRCRSSSFHAIGALSSPERPSTRRHRGNLSISRATADFAPPRQPGRSSTWRARFRRPPRSNKPSTARSRCAGLRFRSCAGASQRSTGPVVPDACCYESCCSTRAGSRASNAASFALFEPPVSLARSARCPSPPGQDGRYVSTSFSVGWSSR